MKGNMMRFPFNYDGRYDLAVSDWLQNKEQTAQQEGDSPALSLLLTQNLVNLDDQLGHAQ